MTDQCKNFTVKGDINACLGTECFQHENWYAIEQQKKIDQQKDKIEELKAFISDLEMENSDLEMEISSWESELDHK